MNETSPSRSQRSRSARTSASISSSSGHARLRRRRGSARPLRRRLAVLGVEVPPAAGRLVAVHQHAVPAAGVAVEVLHQQPPPAPRRRPRREVLAGRHVAAGREPLDLALLGQARDQGRPRRATSAGSPGAARRPRRSGVAVRGRRAHTGTRSPSSAARCRIADRTRCAFCRWNGVRREHPPRLDQQHRPVVVVEEVRAELVAEQPAGRTGRRGVATGHTGDANLAA